MTDVSKLKPSALLRENPPQLLGVGYLNTTATTPTTNTTTITITTTTTTTITIPTTTTTTAIIPTTTTKLMTTTKK